MSGEYKPMISYTNKLCTEENSFLFQDEPKMDEIDYLFNYGDHDILIIRNTGDT